MVSAFTIPNGVCFHCAVQVDSAFTCLVPVIVLYIAFALPVLSFLIDWDSWFLMEWRFPELGQSCQDMLELSWKHGTSRLLQCRVRQSQGWDCARCGHCSGGWLEPGDILCHNKRWQLCQSEFPYITIQLYQLLALSTLKTLNNNVKIN